MVEERISRRDIDEVKKRFIEENLLLTPVEVAGVLSVSVRTVYRLIEEGSLTRANGHSGASKTRIRAAAVRAYRERIEE